MEVAEKITKIAAFIKPFAEFKSALNQDPSVAIAKDLLERMDFPTTRTEEWKYTRTTRISAQEWQIKEDKSAINISPFLIEGLEADVIVFVNGSWRKDLSTLTEQKGLTISGSTLPGKELTSYTNVFEALNTAYCTGILSVHVNRNTIIEKPIHFIHLTTGDCILAQPLIQVSVEKSSQANIIESFVSLSANKSFSNRRMDVHVGENSELHIDKIQVEGEENFLLNDDNVRIDTNGRFTINTITIDGAWVRNDLHISLDGENIEANLHGCYLPRKKQLVDNHTSVDHRFPHCNSNELYKGLLNDQGIGVFNGKVYVQPDAQKTNAFQSNSNILLSDDAQMNTKPELEIYADDVKCSHGTTTGQMDDNALFYLKSRGLGEENAKKLLSTAFINDVLNKIKNPLVRNYATRELESRELLLS